MVSVGDSGSKSLKEEECFDDEHIGDYLLSHIAKGIRLIGEVSNEIRERVIHHSEICPQCQERIHLIRQAMALIPWSKK